MSLKIVLCAYLLSSFFCLNSTTPYFRIRSQGQDTARELAGWTKEIHFIQPERCSWYATVASTSEYTDSFDSKDLTRCLFDTSCLEACCVVNTNCLEGCPADNSCVGECRRSLIAISGSRVPDRKDSDWLADYFGLPTDFSSTIRVSPQIKNSLINWSVFVGLDNWAPGLFFKAHLPLVSTKWSLDVCESITDPGELGYDGGYVTDGPLPRNALLDSFTQFITGQMVPQVDRGLELEQAFLGEEITSTHAITFEPLQYAKWADNCCKQRRKTKIADIHLAWGFEMYNTDCGIFAPYVTVVVPTGNRPTGEFFFEPIVGNGHHWEVGGGLLAAKEWHGSGERRFALYIEGVVTHLFKTRQCRVFDLKKGCNSRYMLALKLGQPVMDLFAHPNQAVEDGAVAPEAQFISTFAPVANLSKQRVNVRADVQTDITLMASYGSCSGNFTLDVGYNFWYLSCEKIELAECNKCTNPLFDGKTWALKGDSQVFGYTEIPCTATIGCPTGIDSAFGSIIPLSPSQQCATIHEGLNNFVGPDPDQGGFDGLRPTQNPGVDNAEFAQTAPDAATALPILDRFVPGTGLPIKTSNPPVFLSLKDLDICGARKKNMSHKVFGALSYRWPLCDKSYVPYASLGGKVEFGRTDRSHCTQNTEACITSFLDPDCQDIVEKGCDYCTLSEWGVWLKGGVSF